MKPTDDPIVFTCPKCEQAIVWLKRGQNWVMAPAETEDTVKDAQGWTQVTETTPLCSGVRESCPIAPPVTVVTPVAENGNDENEHSSEVSVD